MNCKDCIHYDVCKKHNDRLDYETGRMQEYDCNNFTNKSDFVEVVRCKDCKFVCDMGMSGLYCEHPDNRNPIGCIPTDFCNNGERMAEK